MKTSFVSALRRMLCLLLALCLVAGMSPAAFAAGDLPGGYEEEEISKKLLDFIQEFWPKVDEDILLQDPVEYVPREDSYYVALGDSSVCGENSYPQLLAEALDIPFENLAKEELKFTDELYAVIEANEASIAKADLITIGFSAHVFFNNAIEYILYSSMGAPSTGNPLNVDWVGLLGEEYAADIASALDEMYNKFVEYGLPKTPASLMVDAVEACAYSVTNYAVHLPELLATLREYNPEAVIAVVGLYDATQILSVEMEGSEQDFSMYLDMIMDAAADHATDCCATVPDAAYVSVTNTESVGEAEGAKVNLNVNKPTEGLMYNANIIRNKLIPAATGHTYIKNRILQRIVPIYRVAGGNRFETSFLVADQLKASLDVKRFESVIIASGVNFADALSGSYLAAVKGAPILLSFNDEYNQLAVDYIKANLTEDGMVYILGGEKAVPKTLDVALSGYAVKRLAGANRFETNLLILKEVGVGDKDILVCTGTNFADSLAASATGLPILLVYNDLFASQKGYLTTLTGQNSFRVIGGTSAVSEKIETDMSAYGETDRVFGTNRISTSVAIADEFFTNTEKIVLASAANYPDGLCGGALAYSMDAPLLLTMENFEKPITEYVEDYRIDEGIILGGQSAVSDAAADASFGN